MRLSHLSVQPSPTIGKNFLYQPPFLSIGGACCAGQFLFFLRFLLPGAFTKHTMSCSHLPDVLMHFVFSPWIVIMALTLTSPWPPFHLVCSLRVLDLGRSLSRLDQPPLLQNSFKLLTRFVFPEKGLFE